MKPDFRPDLMEFVEIFEVKDDGGLWLRLETIVRFAARDLDGHVYKVSKIGLGKCAKLISDEKRTRTQLYGLNVFTLLTPRMHDDLKQLAFKAAFDRFPFDVHEKKTDEG